MADEAVRNAAAESIAVLAGVDESQVDVTFSVIDTAGRRLASASADLRRLAAGMVKMSYTILIPADTEGGAAEAAAAIQQVMADPGAAAEAEAALVEKVGDTHTIKVLDMSTPTVEEVAAPTPAPTPSSDAVPEALDKGLDNKGEAQAASGGVIAIALVVIAAVSGVLFAVVCARRRRRRLLEVAKAGGQVKPPGKCALLCFGPVVVYCWEGCSRNVWKSCFWPWFPLCCWKKTPYPMQNGVMVEPNPQVQLGGQQPDSEPTYDVHGASGSQVHAASGMIDSNEAEVQPEVAVAIQPAEAQPKEQVAEPMAVEVELNNENNNNNGSAKPGSTRIMVSL